jgi:3-oxoacyl-[acyl-carrier protein] reductase
MTQKINKVAIVTGAAGGIGAAVSERLARDGFTVIVNYAGKTEPAEARKFRCDSSESISRW